MPKYTAVVTVEITQVEVEATSQVEANEILLEDAKTRFPKSVVVIVHS